MKTLKLIHVYAKIYEQDGRVILIRLVRYSLDGTCPPSWIEIIYSQTCRSYAIPSQVYRITHDCCFSNTIFMLT